MDPDQLLIKDIQQGDKGAFKQMLDPTMWWLYLK
jgi:hypothetical protein